MKPRKLYHDRNSWLIFFVFTILLAPNTADAVEERNEDVEEVLETSGNIFEVEQSDFEDEDDELEFVDSFV